MLVSVRLGTAGFAIASALAAHALFAVSSEAATLVGKPGRRPDAHPVTVRAVVVRVPQACVRDRTPLQKETPAAVPPIVATPPAAPAPPDYSQRWGTTVKELFYVNLLGHSVRMLQQRTRVELGGPFLKEWFRSAKPIFTQPHWYDEGSFSINYIGHSMSGAVYGMIQRQNHGRAWNAEVGSTEYWRNVPRALAVSALASFQFEVGPMSEASLGNVGMDSRRQGYIDLVVTPALGTAWMIGQDAFDKYVMRKIESKVHNTVLRASIRTITDLPRVVANTMAGHAPWYRQDRPLGDR